PLPRQRGPHGDHRRAPAGGRGDVPVRLERLPAGSAGAAAPGGRRRGADPLRAVLPERLAPARQLSHYRCSHWDTHCFPLVQARMRAERSTDRGSQYGALASSDALLTVKASVAPAAAMSSAPAPAPAPAPGSAPAPDPRPHPDPRPGPP